MPAIVQQLCDVCYAEDVTTAGTAHVAKLGTLERVVILCDEHEKSMLTPLLELMQEHGAKPDPAPMAVTSNGRKSPDLTTRIPLPVEGMTLDEADALVNAGLCVFPGCPYEGGNRTRVGSHIKHAHGTTLSQLGIGHRGGRRPKSTVDEHLVCDECDVKGFRTTQGLQSHRSRVHGRISTSPHAVAQREKRAAARKTPPRKRGRVR